ncbi:MAG TPA: HAD family phosphatase [Thermoplasmata archaeon]|nr:HAD family phosphatase [Thermoplasmata archaeon]
MARVSLLLWDVGGVLLSNGWDHAGRAAAAERFHLDAEDLERRHDHVAEAFETGRLDLAQYLATTVFNIPRPFTPDDVRAFIRARSVPYEAALACARSLRKGGAYVMVALNNESIELNEYRVSTFHLRDIFHAFLSSCYTGRRKPDPDAFRYALQITRHDPDEALFLDDRPENVEAADRLGLRTVRVRDPARVREELASAGVVAG